MTASTTRAATKAAALLLATFAGVSAGAEACDAYQMDVLRELELFREEAIPLDAGTRAEDAPRIATGRLYAVHLATQERVRHPSPPTRKPVDSARHGGVLRFTVTESGSYRVSLDANFWVDVVHEGAPLATEDFRGNRECQGPRKIVTFQLPAGAELLVQLVDAGVPSVKLSITPKPQKDW
jgi:hypothetical protein